MLSDQTGQMYKLFLLSETLLDTQQQAVLQFLGAQKLSLISPEFAQVDDRCATLLLEIGKEHLEKFQLSCKLLAEKLAVDLVLLSNEQLKIRRKLAVFDMDSTLIKVEVIDELAKRAGVGEQVIAITAAAMRGELDFNQSFKQRLGLLKGLSATVLAELAANLPMMEGMQTLIEGLQQRGYKTAILSGGFNYFAEYLQQKYHFDYAYSNQLDIENGQVTGRVVGAIVNAEMKVSYLQQIAEKEGLDLSATIAVGDGANDLAMLAAAGLGVAFHAKPLVKEQAEHVVSNIGLDALLYLIAE